MSHRSVAANIDVRLNETSLEAAGCSIGELRVMLAALPVDVQAGLMRQIVASYRLLVAHTPQDSPASPPAVLPQESVSCAPPRHLRLLPGRLSPAASPPAAP